MKRNIVIISVVCLVVVSLIVWWATETFVIVEEDVSFGPSYAARKDPWLAIERSLSSLPGVNRYSDASEIDLNYTSVAILYNWNISSIDSDELISWIARGGRLILIFESLEYEDEDESADEEYEDEYEDGDYELPDDPLFDDLYPVYSDGSFSNMEAVTDKFVGISEVFSSLPQKITVDQDIDFIDAYEDETTGVYYEGEARKAVIRIFGDGVLFACGAPEALYNDGLKSKENRELAGFFFGQAGEKASHVWLPEPYLFFSDDENTLDVLPVLLSSALVFLMLFWMGAPRIGSTIPEEVRHRRSLRERFQAEGQFLWKHKAGNKLLGNEESTSKYGKKAFVDAVNSIINSSRTGAGKHHDY